MVAIAAKLEFSAAPPGPRLQLVAAALRLACAALAREGCFRPFGLALAQADTLLDVAALPAGPAPDVEDLIALLQAGLEAGRRSRRYTATALVFESEIPLAGGASALRAIELRVCDEWSASTLCFPHVRERGEVRLEWPHWRGEVASARLA